MASLTENEEAHVKSLAQFFKSRKGPSYQIPLEDGTSAVVAPNVTGQMVITPTPQRLQIPGGYQVTAALGHGHLVKLWPRHPPTNYVLSQMLPEVSVLRDGERMLVPKLDQWTITSLPPVISAIGNPVTWAQRPMLYVSEHADYVAQPFDRATRGIITPVTIQQADDNWDLILMNNEVLTPLRFRLAQFDDRTNTESPINATCTLNIFDSGWTGYPHHSDAYISPMYEFIGGYIDIILPPGSYARLTVVITTEVPGYNRLSVFVQRAPERRVRNHIIQSPLDICSRTEVSGATPPALNSGYNIGAADLLIWHARNVANLNDIQAPNFVVTHQILHSWMHRWEANGNNAWTRTNSLHNNQAITISTDRNTFVNANTMSILRPPFGCHRWYTQDSQQATEQLYMWAKIARLETMNADVLP